MKNLQHILDPVLVLLLAACSRLMPADLRHETAQTSDGFGPPMPADAEVIRIERLYRRITTSRWYSASAAPAGLLLGPPTGLAAATG